MTLNWRHAEGADLTGWIKNAAAVVFKRPKEHVVVTKDSLYQRVHRNNMIELAKVVGIGEDSLGICHVRFQTSYAWSSGRVESQGTRLLAMDCFAERFQPATTAATAAFCTAGPGHRAPHQPRGGVLPMRYSLAGSIHRARCGRPHEPPS